MKIDLKNESGIQVLSISGEITTREVKVLHAGVVKLFKDGRNKIVIFFKDQKDISPEIIRDIAQLNLSARELAGKIILSSEVPELLRKIETFASPPVLQSAAGLTKAFELMKADEALEAEEAAQGKAGGSVELLQQLEKFKEEITTLKAQIKQKEQGEVNNLKKQNAALKKQVQICEEKIVKLVEERQLPPLAEGFVEKIKKLEAQIETFVVQQSQAPAPKGAS